jgi:hypothetical protein
MCTKFSKNILIRSLAKQVQIQFTESRRESIRIFDVKFGAVVWGHSQCVAPLARRQDAFKYATVVDFLHAVNDFALGVEQRNSGGEGQQAAYESVSAGSVWPENRERVPMSPGDKRFHD